MNPKTVVSEIKAQWAPGYLKLDFFTLGWLFVLGSIIGLVVEIGFHFLVYGNYESRAGLVWGPFSPIYGVGAALLTIFLNRFYYSHNVVIFLVAMLVGSCIEFSTSWLMETFWGASAWDYTGTFGSIAGRTNFVFGMMWGMLGLFWVRYILPLVKKLFSHFDPKRLAERVITILMTIFMLVNVFFTVASLGRQHDRINGIPASNVLDEVCDEWFPDDWLEERFHNMTVVADDGSERRPY